ncbi:MAG: tetratricopeptide repeat protein [Bacteroidales bacterium]|nr:tetratricopeptide repeat protein [Bacteroidales bacterium]
MKINTLIYVLLTASALLAGGPLQAQADKREVRAGNRRFGKGEFKEAEIDYRKAVLKDSLSVAGEYNLASSLYRQQDWDGAGKALQTVKDIAPATENAARWHYNNGDVALQKKDYAAAVKAFRESLLLDPGDLDAKENYIYAKLMLQNQQNGGGGGSDNQDQQDNQDRQQNQDQQDQQDQQQDQDEQDNSDQQEQPQQQISPQQAQQMLQAIQAKEKDTQDKVNKEKAAALKSRQKDKNW